MRLVENPLPTKSKCEKDPFWSISQHTSRSIGSLLGMSATELALVDPIEINLSVAKSIDELSGLDVASLTSTVDE